MRPISLGQPLGNSIEAKVNWIMQCMRQIEIASRVDLATVIGQDFTVTPPAAEGRTIDPATISHADLATVVATLLGDMQRGGPKRT